MLLQKKCLPMVNLHSFFVERFHRLSRSKHTLVIRAFLGTQGSIWLQLKLRSPVTKENINIEFKVNITFWKDSLRHELRTPERKQPSLHGRKFNPNPNFLGMAGAYFVCHIGPIFQITLIYAFIGCPQSVILTNDQNTNEIVCCYSVVTYY